MVGTTRSPLTKIIMMGDIEEIVEVKPANAQKFKVFIKYIQLDGNALKNP